MKWNDVTITIPAMLPRRAAFVEALMTQIKSECPGAVLLICPHVDGTPARVDFPRALTDASRMGRSWVLQLEDDVVLCPGFGTLALNIPDGADVVTLFSRSKRDLEMLRSGYQHRTLTPSRFSMSQGFLIRSELAAGVEPYAPGWYARNPKHNRAADLLLGAFLSSKGAKTYVRLPSLVQHRPGPSTLPGHFGARQSESYRHTFGEVL